MCYLCFHQIEPSFEPSSDINRAFFYDIKAPIFVSKVLSHAMLDVVVETVYMKVSAAFALTKQGRVEFIDNLVADGTFLGEVSAHACAVRRCLIRDR